MCEDCDNSASSDPSFGGFVEHVPQQILKYINLLKLCVSARRTYCVDVGSHLMLMVVFVLINVLHHYP